MPTFTTFRGDELPDSFAEKIGAAPNAEVKVEVISPEELETNQRLKAGGRLKNAMSQFSREAQAAGITDDDIKSVINED
ncbi:MAG: hypothetical protein HQL69_00040 [Magnetococcales bacterium]|nr:hypothetical protein [Magnetococcales bacterium]